MGLTLQSDVQYIKGVGPAIGQLDYEGMGGLLQSRKIGKRATSKHLSMSLIGMSADFINAYVI